MSSLNIRGFFLLMIPLFVAGATNDREKVKATKGESFVLFEIPGFADVSKVTVQRPCENGSLVFRYCSPDEEKKGCKSSGSDKYQVHNGTVIVANASFSDQGCYTVKVIGISDITQSLTVVVNEPQYSTVSPESQYSTISPESPHPTSPTPNEGGLDKPVIAAVVLIAIGFAIWFGLVIHCCICKKKKSQKKSDSQQDATIQDGGQDASPAEKDQLLMKDLNLSSIKENKEKPTCVTGL
ncbi:uncharacterized protein LOC127625418 isoform X2 [Xyrauchen texanus]|uniref:uncharacterized protein LOC127625418 isoform X1 n=1 Tax=Xyrauchen texanus TaxID=154827 RepID=UPI0022423B23|nr:uncharacterized protein LOC127625418 isoform X1 [Xyrauchen texanus]XP_051956665.1 uncharacterized protein LOC127625418 isoform X2 [Xyrauchen texanus]